MPDDAPKKPEPISIEREAPAERFVRTLESDSATLKSGGKPDFMQTVEPTAPVQFTTEDAIARAAAFSTSDTIDLDKTPAERLVTASPVEGMPALTAEMMPIGPEERMPAPAPVPPPKAEPATAAPLHTYTSDFADAVQEKNATPASILAAEQDAARPISVPQKRALNISLVVGALVLVVLGTAGTYYAYWYSTRPMTVAVAVLQPASIFVDQRQEVVGTGTALEEAIEQSEQQALASGAIRLIYTTGATSTDASIFSALQWPAPDILLRNIDASASMAGIVNISGTESPFFILSVESYSDTFAGMLDWEPTMESDIAQLFPLYTVGTSTPQALPTFKDEVVDNQNTRLLQDAAGNTLVIYGYWNQQTLVIARNEAAFSEIIGRLANSSTQQ